MAVPPPERTVPNYLVQAILTTICCCLPFGIVAIVFAAQVNSKLAAGDYDGAIDASNKAKMWSWIAFGSGLAVQLLYLAVMIPTFIAASKHGGYHGGYRYPGPTPPMHP